MKTLGLSVDDRVGRAGRAERASGRAPVRQRTETRDKIARLRASVQEPAWLAACLWDPWDASRGSQRGSQQSCKTAAEKTLRPTHGPAIHPGRPDVSQRFNVGSVRHAHSSVCPSPFPFLSIDPHPAPYSFILV